MSLKDLIYPQAGIWRAMPCSYVCSSLKPKNLFMKKVCMQAFSVLLLSVVLFTSCKKDSSSNNNTALPSGKSEVKFNYTGAASGNFASNVTMSTVLKSTSLINVSASFLSGTTPHMVLFILPADIAVGSHSQNAAGDVGGATFSFNILGDGWAVAGASATGFQINITRNDATGIEGTFSGQLGNDTDGTKISTTGGTFKATF